MAKFQNLPPEILLRIMEYAIQITPEKIVSQYSKGAVYLNLNVGAINSCLREVFLKTIRMRYVLIELRFYRGLLYQRDDILQKRLDHYFQCRKATALVATMNAFPNKFSILRIDVKQGRSKAQSTDADIQPRKEAVFTSDVGRYSLFPSSRAVFIVDKMKVLLMCHILQQQISPNHITTISCQVRGREAAIEIDEVLHSLAATLRDLPFSMQSSLHAFGGYMLSTDIDGILESFRISTYRNPMRVAKVSDHYLTGMHQLLVAGMSFLDVLPLAAESLYWMCPKADPRAILVALQPICLHLNIYISLVLRRLGDYLLCSNNTHEHQSHYLLRDESIAITVLRGSIIVSDVVRIGFRQYTAVKDDPSSQAVLLSMFHLILSRVHLELGLARAATLPGFSISELVRRGPPSCDISRPSTRRYVHRRYSETQVTVGHHLFEARKCLNAICRGLDTFPVHPWVYKASKTINEIEDAVKGRGKDFQKHILVEPMPALSCIPWMTNMLDILNQRW